MHEIRLIFAGVLFFFAALYLFTSVKDTAGDLRLIFERRLVRRYLAKFSIRTMFCITAIAALYFAIVMYFQVPLQDLPLLTLGLGILVGAGLLIRIAVKDLTFRGSRRRYRDHFDRESDGNPPDPPVIRP